MNKVILIGNMCKDPELQTTQDGVSKVTFDIAVQRQYRDKSGNYPADFIRCVAWRHTAEFIGKYIKKGYKLMVEGSLQNRKYTAQDGSNHYVWEVIVDRVENLTPRPKEGFSEVQDDELPWKD